MKILVLNGPNINFLGIREPHIYGSNTYNDLVNKIQDYCDKKSIEVLIIQSNHEGVLVDEIQKAYSKLNISTQYSVIGDKSIFVLVN